MSARKIESDQDRVRLATREDSTMYGPAEVYRCPDHPRRWVTFRWFWDVPEDGDQLAALQSGSDAEIIRECQACADERDREMGAYL